MKIFITGVEGFIGRALAHRILKETKHDVLGVDVKHPKLISRNADLEQYGDRFVSKICDVTQEAPLNDIFWASLPHPDVVIHLAGYTGVRKSMINQKRYLTNNIIGMENVLEIALGMGVEHVIYASSSSVYGDVENPEQNKDKPRSIYAATKCAMEDIAHVYSSNHGLKTTGLRFFTVYGPDGREDMAVYQFTKKILNDEPIEIYNGGNHSRAFTYIDDITKSIMHLINKPPRPDHNIFDIGGDTRELSELVSTLEKLLGKEAEKIMKSKRLGDVVSTGVSGLRPIKGVTCDTTIEVGLARFVEWYKANRI